MEKFIRTCYPSSPLETWLIVLFKLAAVSYVVRILGFQLQTLWLFTVSDHKPLVYPMTMTGLLNLSAGLALNEEAYRKQDLWSISRRLPAVIFWVWFNFLVFCVGNQRLPKSVEEDAINKPWRPVPSKRLSRNQATALWVALQIAVLGGCTHFGATSFTVTLLFLGWLYNDCEGGSHPVARNLINACAVVCFALGATTVAYGSDPFSLSEEGQFWQWMIAAIVFTTLQIQDLCDQDGDRCRGRNTIPLVFGDRVARWSVVVPMLWWSYMVPRFWETSWYGYLAPLVVGGLICCRVLTLKDAQADRVTYKLWGVWITSLLAVPSMSSAH
ncbi:hypothetical protein BU16DRAFT_385637 [Lophium mytilinum]|uniref:UbiA prenyltransferase n=1 Tax=Lophium mytilinum TaxID=390894 RepID=A0A6A6QS84_9PEZI|nr:hypothetical protein BU16DRAFT_385637 [Lophium mytilinum]